MRGVIVETVVSLGLLGVVVACSPRTPAQAEAAYTAELLRCVDNAATLAESRACRADVDRRWAVRRDGGAP